MPKKQPLISKVVLYHKLLSCIDLRIHFHRKFYRKCQDHERAYFDSADWALGKVLFLYLHPPFHFPNSKPVAVQ